MGRGKGVENSPSNASIQADPEAQRIVDYDSQQSLVCLQHFLHVAKRNFFFPIGPKGMATV